MNQTATITIQTVSPPSAGKRNWLVTDTAGTRYSANPKIGQPLQAYVGQTLQIIWKPGDKVNFLEDAQLPQGGVAAPPPMPAPAPMPQPVAAPPPIYTPAPAPIAAPPAAVSEEQRQENMFVMGVVGRAMGSGSFSSNDVLLLTHAAVQAWESRHARPQPNAEGPFSEANPPPPPGFQ